MPQARTLLHGGDALQVERVMLHSKPLQWSPTYEVPSRRLVLPASGVTEFRIEEEQTVLLDSLTALCLPTGLPYRMKPLAAAARSSIVVTALAGGEDSLPPPRAWMLTPRALLHLRRHWRALARGTTAATEATPLVLRAVLEPGAEAVGATFAAPSGSQRAQAAVHRAKSFMAARIAAAHQQGEATPWTLHDVADGACCSLFHLAHTFRRATGLSLHGYRQRLRLAAALQRLEEGERDLAALAHDLGFSSQSHLGETFRRGVGATMGQVRGELAV